MNLWEFIREHLLKNSEQRICENEASLSFEEAAIWAEKFSGRLRGISCCAILCTSEMAAAMALLACFAAKVTALPLSMRYGEAHCKKILDAVDPDAILTDAGGGWNVCLLKGSRYRSPKFPPALIMCTSGTTGKPKGIMLGERSIRTNVSDIAEYFEMDRSDTILIARPLYHCAVLTGEFLTAIVRGAKIRFYSGPFHPAKMAELIGAHQISAFCGTPTLLSLMARLQRKPSANVPKHICISGECMSADTGRNIRAAFPKSRIYHIYGLTEACPRVSYLPPEFFDDFPDCVGVPLKSVSVRVLRRDGKPCRKNEEGILFVKGDNVMSGYYRDPEKTQAVLKNGWLRTGDVALINDRGFLKIRGREDDLIIRAGMNIYPAEIEGTLKEDARVKEVLVYGFRDSFGMQIGMKIAGDFSSADEVKRLCIGALPSFCVPSSVELLDELPKNGSGKIIRGGSPA